MPIRVVLDRNLNDALDIQRSKTQAVFVEVLNKKKADTLPYLMYGTSITSYGIVIYYFLPLSLMSMNLTMVSKIVIFILIGLLFALTLLAFNLQGYIERFCTSIFLPFEIKSVRTMVVKNLSAHRRRNQMTALIYSLALGFLIFLSISCRMQISFNSHEELKSHGCQFRLQSQDFRDLPVNELEDIIKANTHIIEEFSWVTAPIDRYSGSRLLTATVDDMTNH